MKTWFLNFFKKYWFCFLLSVIMVIGLSLSTIFADLYESGRGIIRFDLRELYLIFGLPLYSLIYGCLSYIKVKKIWIPQLILCIVAFLYWFRFDITELTWPGTYIWSVYPTIFSLIGTGITKFVYYIIKELRTKNSEARQSRNGDLR